MNSANSWIVCRENNSLEELAVWFLLNGMFHSYILGRSECKKFATQPQANNPVWIRLIDKKRALNFRSMYIYIVHQFSRRTKIEVRVRDPCYTRKELLTFMLGTKLPR